MQVTIPDAAQRTRLPDPGPNCFPPFFFLFFQMRTCHHGGNDEPCIAALHAPGLERIPYRRRALQVALNRMAALPV